MEYTPLNELIEQLEYGTKLHIGVLLFGRYGNKVLYTKQEQTIHKSPVCDASKLDKKHGFERCFACRNLAINKAVKTKEAFGGICINGVYEYTYPIIIADSVTGIIFVGNILTETGRQKIKLKLPPEKNALTDTMEKDYDEERCRALCGVIDSYIKLIFETQPINYNGTDVLIENIKAYLIANLEFNPNLTQLSQVFGYNKKYLGRLFKAKTGTSITEFENIQRIKLAKHLIKENKLTLTEIALKAGFNNITYFGTVFKSICKCTPKEYKNSKKQ